MDWNGRRLESISQAGTEIVSYDYNIDGQRVKKTALDLETGEPVTTEYFYNGSILAGEKTGNDVIIYMYDNNGDFFGFTYNGTEYYYIKNAQNDVVAIADADGSILVRYYYSAWGEITDCQDISDNGIGSINPITYRSYYKDELSNTVMYYLNSRYYYPEICRFLNADSYVQTGQGMLDKNMFAYCMNNPIMFCDPSGHYVITIPAVGYQKPNIQNDYVVTGKLNNNGTYTYVATPLSSAGHSSSGDLSSQQMHENAEIVYALLNNKGWSDNAIYAALGNMQHESVTINPGRFQNGGGPGYGIVQWDPASKYLNWAKVNGYADDSLVGQVEYLIYSMQPGNGAWFKNSNYPKDYLSYSNFIVSTDSINRLTKVFVWSYERPGISHMDSRIEKACYWASYFSGG